VQFRAASHLADLSRRCGEVEFADGLARFLRLLFAGAMPGLPAASLAPQPAWPRDFLLRLSGTLLT
jgi:hypothetical protein